MGWHSPAAEAARFQSVGTSRWIGLLSGPQAAEKQKACWVDRASLQEKVVLRPRA